MIFNLIWNKLINWLYTPTPTIMEDRSLCYKFPRGFRFLVDGYWKLTTLTYQVLNRPTYVDTILWYPGDNVFYFIGSPFENFQVTKIKLLFGKKIIAEQNVDSVGIGLLLSTRGFKNPYHLARAVHSVA